MKKLSLALIATLLSTSAFAASSPWFNTEGVRIRLISLPAPDGKTIDAGLQIELQKGWKTYWRAPGASGLPPQLDFSGSKNVAATKLDFPVPITFGDNKNLTVGYDKSVTLPITVEPLFSNRPVTINANGLVGICGDICVPVQFQLSIVENGRGGSTRDVASALLLAKSNLIKPASDGFKVTETVYQGDQLSIVANVPNGSVKNVALVEGPGNWYLTPANAESVENGVARYLVDLKDIPKDAKPLETELRISLVSDGSAVEQLITPTER